MPAEVSSILQFSMSSTLTALPAWHALLAHQRSTVFELRELFAADPRRSGRYSITVGDVLLDYSKHYLTDETVGLLIGLADARQMRQCIRRLMSGDRINTTENRPALHTALRANTPVVLDGRDITQKVKRVRAQMRRFAD